MKNRLTHSDRHVMALRSKVAFFSERHLSEDRDYCVVNFLTGLMTPSLLPVESVVSTL
jgi:hypothetical protein